METETHSLHDVLWILLCSGLVLLMQAGFLCLETGLLRAKNTVNVAFKNIADFCVGSALYWIVGFGLMFGVSSAGLFGTTGYFFGDLSDPWWSAVFLFQLFFCATTATIVSGAVAERTRFGAYLVITVMISALIHPVVGHWVWGGLSGEGGSGWLEAIGYLDFAGASVVHSVGGWVALAAVIVVGPSIGRFGESARRITPYSLPIAALGTLLLLVGFLGFNGGSALALEGGVSGIIINTTLAGAAGGLGMLGLSWAYDRLVRIESVMNGLLSGLVAITASCNVVTPLGAVVIGLVSAPVFFATSALLERLEIDDAIGAVPVHAGGGVWGTLAVALFGSAEQWAPGQSVLGQLGIQALGSIVIFVWSFSLAYGLLRLLNHFSPLRVSEEDEIIGLNIAENGVESEIDELCHQMEEQSNSGDFSQPVSVHRGTDIGLVAVQYNGVLNKMSAQQDELLQAADALNTTNRNLSEAQVASEANRRVLDEKVTELESFHALAIDREIEMIELKREINRLSQQLGEPEAFDLSFADARIDA